MAKIALHTDIEQRDDGFYYVTTTVAGSAPCSPIGPIADFDLAERIQKDVHESAITTLQRHANGIRMAHEQFGKPKQD